MVANKNGRKKKQQGKKGKKDEKRNATFAQLATIYTRRRADPHGRASAFPENTVGRRPPRAPTRSSKGGAAVHSEVEPIIENVTFSRRFSEAALNFIEILRGAYEVR